MFREINVKEILNELDSDTKKQYNEFKKSFDKKVNANKKDKEKITTV
ncbi:hypothetical protein SH1V18_48130 [Vallitalea longa]|uniref:Uncharacterized protein n=1 Tax=Vallitalea longa TaxID=2936439 RepID=A0A9W5YHE7_9FIRM|nr:hypothetical protein [Vallitalea longa]GKX32333.1 hypothetical protein SH1V18_48130 [Vallitalea longa]